MRVDVVIPEQRTAGLVWVRSFELPGPPAVGTEVEAGGVSFNVARVGLVASEGDTIGSYYRVLTDPICADYDDEALRNIVGDLTAHGWRPL